MDTTATSRSHQCNSDQSWDALRAELDIYVEAGGIFREPIADFEKRYGYESSDYSQAANCFSSAVGLLVNGVRPLSPGNLNYLFQKTGQEISRIDLADINQPTYDLVQPYVFRNQIETNLIADGFRTELPLDRISDFFPVIAAVYRFNDSPAQKIADFTTGRNDYHFLVPHKDRSGMSYELSAREGIGGVITRLSFDEIKQKKFSENSCSTKIYYAPKNFMGTKIEVTDRRMASHWRNPCMTHLF